MTSLEKKKTALMIVDGGHLRKLLEYDHEAPDPDLPRLNAGNINRILRNCVTDDEDLQRIYYYDCEPFVDRFHTPYPDLKHKKETIAMYESDLRKRIRRGSKFHIINPIIDPTGACPEIPSTEAAGTAVWRVNEHTKQILWELGQKDLFVVRHGRITFKGWRKNTKSWGPKYHPDVQQKGVDMLIGLDIATIAISSQAQRIIFVANDTDFVPALKFVRRTGRKVQVVMIDLPGGQDISPHLKMNSDYCREIPWPRQKKEKPPTAMANALKNANKL